MKFSSFMLHSGVFLLSTVACGVHLHGDPAALASERHPPTYGESPPRAHGSRTVFIIGSSVDRYATEWFCDAEEPQGQHAKFVACSDKRRDLAVAYLFHPGVGYNGDLQPPFFNYTRYKTIPSSSVFKAEDYVNKMLGIRDPEIVIVESSLWDLAVWKTLSPKHQDVGPGRVQQWCERDLPNLLNVVSKTFPTSRVVFRTAPTIAHSNPVPGLNNITAYNPEGVQMLYDCVASRMRQPDQSGQLFGKYDVIDYHRVMENLIVERTNNSSRGLVGHLWLKDGFHPNKEPARRYFNEILKFMKLPQIEKKDWPEDVIPIHETLWSKELDKAA